MPTPRRALACLALAAALAAQVPAALANPGYYRVTGVAADDTLNVRAEPSASSADIGDLPPDQTGVEVIDTDPSGTWGRIVWEEANGWISMQFLAPQDVQRVGETQLAAGVMCAGTEPFWSVQLSPSSAVFSEPDGATYAMSMQGSRVAEGHGDFPVQLGFGGADASANLIVRPRACSDGMSDRTYPWQVDLLLGTASGGRFVTGCCHLPLETGFH